MRFPDGSIVRPEVEVLDQYGNVFHLDSPSFLTRDSATPKLGGGSRRVSTSPLIQTFQRIGFIPSCGFAVTNLSTFLALSGLVTPENRDATMRYHGGRQRSPSAFECSDYFALSALKKSLALNSWALPQALALRAFGAEISVVLPCCYVV